MSRSIKDISPASSTLHREIFPLLVLAGIVVAGLMTVTLYSVVVQTRVPDQMVHRMIAEEMAATGELATPHFLYQLLVIGTHKLTDGWLLSAVVANLIPQALLVGLLYMALRTCFKNTRWEQNHVWLARLICAALALALVIFAPLFNVLWSFGFTTDPLLLGFVTPTTYHNPTTIVMRPLALALYLLINTTILRTDRPPKSRLTQLEWIAISAGLTVLCGLSKPNYLLAVLPALGLWLAWGWWHKRPLAWGAATFGVVLPAVLFLAWQYYFAYVNPSEQLEGSSIIFAPFDAILTISGGSRGIMILRFVASITFPVAVYACYWQQARHNAPLNFAWLTFLFGASYMYLFAELGTRLSHGNFLWSAYITLFVLNFASVRFALKQWLARGTGVTLDWRTGVISVMLVLHVVSGIAYIQYVNEWLLSHVT